MTLSFLTVDGAAAQGAVARSPMEHLARAAGARFEVRDGWSMAVDYGAGAEPGADTVAWADTSHLRKLQLQDDADQLDATGHLRLGEAVRAQDAWWCRLTPTRALVIGGTEPVPGALDLTSTFASLTLTGPLARETLARFCALDLRPAVAPVGALRPGSVARQPGIVIREAPERYLLLFGWAIGEYMWSMVADAATALGGGPVGVDALAAVQEPVGA